MNDILKNNILSTSTSFQSKKPLKTTITLELHKITPLLVYEKNK